MPAVLNIDDLLGSLSNIRDDGFSPVFFQLQSLNQLLGEHKEPSTRQLKALMEKLIRVHAGDTVNAEILRMSFGLLEGCEHPQRITQRYNKFLLRFLELQYPDRFKQFSAGEITQERVEKLTRQNLSKKERTCIHEFAEFILRINKKADIDGYIQCVNEAADDGYVPPYDALMGKIDTVLDSTADIMNAVAGSAELIIQKIEAGENQPAASSFMPSDTKILTPNAQRWVNSSVIGREEFTDKLCGELGAGTPHLQLTGMAGIGKTETLNKVYIHFADNPTAHSFDHIGLLSCSGSLNETLAQQLAYPEHEDGPDAAWNYLRALCDSSRVLLLIDDIRVRQDNRTQAASFGRLFTLKAAVLLASRVLMKGFDERPVGFLGMEDCIQVFEAQRHLEAGAFPPTLSEGERKKLSIIMEERAGCNALIVNRLGAMARDYTWSIDEMSDRLESCGFDIKKGMDDEEKLQEEISKLYSLDGIAPAPRNLLEAFAIFPPTPMLQQSCVRLLHRDAGTDEDGCRLLLNKLGRHTWLIRQPENNSVLFSMHQLVRSAVLSQVKISFDNHLALVGLSGKSLFGFIKTDFLYARAFSPVAVSIAEYFSDVVHMAFYYLLNALGDYFEAFFDYAKEQAYKEKALGICEALQGPEHVCTALQYYRVSRFQRDKEKGKELRAKAQAVLESATDTELSTHREGFSTLARIYARQGDFDKALEFHHKALAADEAKYGADSPFLSVVYHDIAHLYQRSGDTGLALEYYHKARIAVEKQAGAKTLRVATVYKTIAQLYIKTRDYVQALEWLRKIYDIYENLLGSDHPRTAGVFVDIINTYFLLGNCSQALKWAHDFLERYEQQEELKLETADICNLIAAIYEDEGNYSRALEFYGKRLDIRRQAQDMQLYDLFDCRMDFVRIYLLQENILQAMQDLTDMLRESEETYGAEHVATAKVNANLAAAYAYQGSHSEAREYYRKALPIFEEKLGSEHIETIDTRRLLDELGE